MALAQASALQSGIYLSPSERPPNAFLFVVLDVAPDVSASRVEQAVAGAWAVLTELRRGAVRDLAASRPGEADVTIDPRTFDVLLGYGARFFEPGRGLTEAEKPEPLCTLDHPDGPFASLRWGQGVAARSGEGDLCLQLTGRDAQAVYRAAVEVWKFLADEGLPIVVRETHAGFARDDGRSWIDFHDGVSNIEPSQRRDAVECSGDPEWNRGGTYLAFLRCGVDLGSWRALSREEQEALVGRDKLSGCALERVDVVDGRLTPHPFPGCPADGNVTLVGQEPFRDPPETGDPIVEASHIHRANQNRAAPTTPAAHRVFRQGYEYLDGIGPDGPGLGLNFVSFQRDLEHLRQILGLSSWLGGVNFGGPKEPTPGLPGQVELISLRAGGFYAVPPREEPFPGAALFS